MLPLRELQARFAAAVLAADGTSPALALADKRFGAERIGIDRKSTRLNSSHRL